MKLENTKIEIFIQIKNYYQRLIESGVLVEGEALPSLRKVAFDIGVNPNTVDKAFRLLEKQGYVDIFPKKGAFVKKIDKNNKKDHLKKFKDVINEMKIYSSKEELIKLLEESYD